MACNKCWLEDPKQSKFCRNCGEALGIRLRCPQCGSENPGDSLFCIVCGARLLEIKKSVKGTQRKCRNCGHFNELDTLFCVLCGEEMTRIPKEDHKQQSVGPSYKTIALVIGIIFLTGVSVKLGVTFSKRGNPSKLNSAPVLTSTSMAKVDEIQVSAVAKNFKCACGGCGELPLATCQCEMPKESVEEKKFIREKLAEGFTVDQVIELLDKTYGHRA
jgi:ribosomal protein L40E